MFNFKLNVHFIRKSSDKICNAHKENVFRRYELLEFALTFLRSKEWTISKEALTKFFLNIFYSLGRLLFKVGTLLCWWTTVATYHRQRHLVLISTVVSRETMRSRISIILDIRACHCVTITSHNFPISNTSVSEDIKENIVRNKRRTFCSPTRSFFVHKSTNNRENLFIAGCLIILLFIYLLIYVWKSIIIIYRYRKYHCNQSTSASPIKYFYKL